jgi:hypothetical protein
VFTDYYLENGGTEQVATVAERQQKLDPEKRQALEALFYGKFQGAIGGKALLEAMRTHPKQTEALKESEGKRAWISARDIEAFYSTQEVAQLYRDAPALSKSRVKVPTTADMQGARRLRLPIRSRSSSPAAHRRSAWRASRAWRKSTWG